MFLDSPFKLKYCGNKNVGGFAISFDVVVIYKEDTKETLHQNPVIGEANQKSTKITWKSLKKIKLISLDNGIFMNATPLNNIWNNQ